LRRSGDERVLGGGFEKVLHVSPLMGMDHADAVRAAAPGGALSGHVGGRRPGGAAVDATLRMPRREVSSRGAAGIHARHPAATLRTLSLIYAHAVVLRLKGVPVHSHPTVA